MWGGPVTVIIIIIVDHIYVSFCLVSSSLSVVVSSRLPLIHGSAVMSSSLSVVVLSRFSLIHESTVTDEMIRRSVTKWLNMEPRDPDDETGAAPPSPRGPPGTLTRSQFVQRRFAYLVRIWLDYRVARRLILIQVLLEYDTTDEQIENVSRQD